MYSKQFAGIFRPLLFLSLLALLVSCGDDNDSDGSGTSLSSGKAITDFSFTSAENPQLGADLVRSLLHSSGIHEYFFHDNQKYSGACKYQARNRKSVKPLHRCHQPDYVIGNIYFLTHQGDENGG